MSSAPGKPKITPSKRPPRNADPHNIVRLADQSAGSSSSASSLAGDLSSAADALPNKITSLSLTHVAEIGQTAAAQATTLPCGDKSTSWGGTSNSSGVSKAAPAASKSSLNPTAGEFVLNPTAGEFVLNPTAGEFVLNPTAGEFVLNPTAGEFVPKKSTASSTSAQPSASQSDLSQQNTASVTQQTTPNGLNPKAVEYVPMLNRPQTSLESAPVSVTPSFGPDTGVPAAYGDTPYDSRAAGEAGLDVLEAEEGPCLTTAGEVASALLNDAFLCANDQGQLEKLLDEGAEDLKKQINSKDHLKEVVDLVLRDRALYDMSGSAAYVCARVLVGLGKKLEMNYGGTLVQHSLSSFRAFSEEVVNGEWDQDGPDQESVHYMSNCASYLSEAFLEMATLTDNLSWLGPLLNGLVLLLIRLLEWPRQEVLLRSTLHTIKHVAQVAQQVAVQAECQPLLSDLQGRLDQVAVPPSLQPLLQSVRTHVRTEWGQGSSPSSPPQQQTPPSAPGSTNQQHQGSTNPNRWCFLAGKLTFFNTQNKEISREESGFTDEELGQYSPSDFMDPDEESMMEDMYINSGEPDDFTNNGMSDEMFGEYESFISEPGDGNHSWYP